VTSSLTELEDELEDQEEGMNGEILDLVSSDEDEDDEWNGAVINLITELDHFGGGGGRTSRSSTCRARKAGAMASCT
jgi:hypothetical protein